MVRSARGIVARLPHSLSTYYLRFALLLARFQQQLRRRSPWLEPFCLAVRPGPASRRKRGNCRGFARGLRATALRSRAPSVLYFCTAADGLLPADGFIVPYPPQLSHCALPPGSDFDRFVAAPWLALPFSWALLFRLSC